MIVADAIAERVASLGAGHVFGVSGANIEDVFAAMNRRSLRIVLCKHEHGAGSAAAAYGLLRGEPGVVLATSGGGAMNLVHSLAEARASRIPLLAIVGEPPLPLQGRGAFQDTSGKAGSVDALQVFRPVTCWAERLEEPRALHAMLDGALEAARSGPGPAVLLVAKDRQAADAGTWAARDRPSPAAVPPPTGEVRWMASRLIGRRVLVIAGPEVARAGARRELSELAHRLGASVAVTPDGRDAVEPGELLGVAGAMGHDAVLRALAGSDVVLLVGTPLPVLARMGLESRLAELEVIALGESEPFVKARPVRAPLRALLAAVVAELPAAAEIAVAPAPAPDVPPAWGAASALAELQRVLPRGATVVVDAGNTGAFAVHHLAPQGGRWILAMGMAGMGFSFGAAVGAACATGERVVVVSGDGAFFMHGMEIHTAVEHELPITYLILDNRAHGMCAVRERLLVGQTGTFNLFQPAHLGAGMAAMLPGLAAWDCTDLRGLGSALALALRIPGPALVSAELPEVEVPPFTAFRPREAR